jgi:lysophospholipase L1-like esterase
MDLMRAGIAGALLIALLASPSRAGAPVLPAPSAGATPLALFFGSSTTRGAGASTPDRRWSSLLSRASGWSEVNAGLSGTTLTDRPGPGRAPSGEARWRSLLEGERPAIVFVMYGANDARIGIPIGASGAPGTFRHAAATVLRGLRAAFPGAVVVLVTPQPARRLEAVRAPYDAALAAEATSAGALVVDGLAAFPADALLDHAADAIHLNDRGHAAFAAHVERALAAAGVVVGRGRGVSPPR